MAARFALHEGQSPRPLQEKATRNSLGQLVHQTRAKAGFEESTVEKSGGGGVVESPPESVASLESALP